MHGHIWTIVPHFQSKLAKERPEAVPWRRRIKDERFGEVLLTGLYEKHPQADRLLVIVHGLGGKAESSYTLKAAQTAFAHGFSTLRINLRGADRSGQDFYHAGLVEDLHAAVTDDITAPYRGVHVLGFSLGGHLSLRYALEPDSRVRSVAAICAPLDLGAAARHIDRRRSTVYRQHLLKGLREMATEVMDFRGQPLTERSLASIKSIYDWDDTIVAPRFGFASADDYYLQMSVGPWLGDLAVPTLFSATRLDPMVKADTLDPWLGGTLPNLRIDWRARGGHVGFPPSMDPVRDAIVWLREH